MTSYFYARIIFPHPDPWLFYYRYPNLLENSRRYWQLKWKKNPAEMTHLAKIFFCCQGHWWSHLSQDLTLIAVTTAMKTQSLNYLLEVKICMVLIILTDIFYIWKLYGDKFATGVNDTETKKWQKTFRRNIFLIYHQCCWLRWFTFSYKYLRNFSKKCEKISTRTFRGQEEVDSWKNTK